MSRFRLRGRVRKKSSDFSRLEPENVESVSFRNVYVIKPVYVLINRKFGVNVVKPDTESSPGLNPL